MQQNPSGSFGYQSSHVEQKIHGKKQEPDQYFEKIHTDINIHNSLSCPSDGTTFFLLMIHDLVGRARHSFSHFSCTYISGRSQPISSSIVRLFDDNTPIFSLALFPHFKTPQFPRKLPTRTFRLPLPSTCFRSAVRIILLPTSPGRIRVPNPSRRHFSRTSHSFQHTPDPRPLRSVEVYTQ